MLTPIRALATLALATLLVTGCSGEEEPGDASGPANELVPRQGPPRSLEPDEESSAVDADAVRDGLVALWVGDDATEEDVATGECFAGALLEGTTPEQLTDVGILDLSGAVVDELQVLDREGAELWVDAQLACTDFVEESTRAQVAATKGKVDRAAYETCLRGALTEDQQRDAAIASVMGDLSGDAVAALSRAQLTCVQQALPPD
ncbi:hypothetical protein [Nocardioides lijunqiniae]|uniref:hypothetical protein n=1 Tax=Nocardioides lijunqiniae TaxID=2760832 RepID=UPI001877E64C|nr:hypothetical protein [Nocardioides lijunqiniae]